MARRHQCNVCPLCRALPVEGSGGWATDFVCGTRVGNLSETILWKGEKCHKTKGSQLPSRKESTIAYWTLEETPTMTIAEARKLK